MCNPYRVTTSQQAIIEWTRAMRDVSGNLPPEVEVYPNYLAPVVRNAPDGTQELNRLQWGMPTPPERKHTPSELWVLGKWMDVPKRCVVHRPIRS